MPLTRKDTQRQTRDRLIAAAHSSIIEEGVAAMSIRNIQRRRAFAGRLLLELRQQG